MLPSMMTGNGEAMRNGALPPHPSAPPPPPPSLPNSTTTTSNATASVTALLTCPMCRKLFVEPCLLDCCHTFCAACLRSAVADPSHGFVACPTCGAVSGLNAGPGLPAPLDPVAAFLVNKMNSEPVCANCDRREDSPVFYCNTCLCLRCGPDCSRSHSGDNDDDDKRNEEHEERELGCVFVSSSSSSLLLSQRSHMARQLALCLRLAATQPLTMFYCKTCGQALCAACREETHRARMFSQHEVVHMSHHLANSNEEENVEMCSKHPTFVARLFCSATRTPLCDVCYDTSTLDVRANTLTVDDAYDQAKRKLDRALISLAELHTSVAEGSSSLASSAASLETTLTRQKTELLELMRRLQANLNARLESAESSGESQLRLIYQKLHTSRLLLPTVQLQLLLSALFVQRAGKLAFLRVVDNVLDRLATLAQMAFPLSLVEEVSRDEGRMEARGMDELRLLILFLTKCLESDDTAKLHDLLAANKTADCRTSENRSDNCDLSEKISSLQDQLSHIRHFLSLLHEDISTERRIRRPHTLVLLKELCLKMNNDHEVAVAQVETHKKALAARWDEISREKEAFKLQLIELRSLQKDLSQIMAISDHLHSFMRNVDHGANKEGNDHGLSHFNDDERHKSQAQQEQLNLRGKLTIPRARGSRSRQSELSPPRASSSKSATLGRGSSKKSTRLTSSSSATRKLSASSEDITPVKESSSSRATAKRSTSKKNREKTRGSQTLEKQEEAQSAQHQQDQLHEEEGEEKTPKTMRSIKATSASRPSAHRLPQRRYSAPTDLDDDYDYNDNEEQQPSENGPMRRRWHHNSRSLDFLLSDSTSEPEEAFGGCEKRSSKGVQRVVADVHAPDPLRKTDSFEGHEQTVANLVESVMRSKRRQRDNEEANTKTANAKAVANNGDETGTVRRRRKNLGHLLS